MTALFLITILLIIAPAGVAGADGLRIAVVTNRERVEPLSVDEIGQIYLKKRRHWEDGSVIIPLNREAGTPIRHEFSRAVYGAAEQHLATYWNEQYFHGIFPPVTLSSDAAVMEYVARDHNAVGYVDADAVDASVRVVRLLKPEPVATPTAINAEAVPTQLPAHTATRP